MTDASLADLGFVLVQERRDGVKQYSKRAHPFLAYWLLIQPGGSAELSWEFELGAYLAAKGFSVSAQDELSLLMFPADEARGSLDESWVQEQLRLVEIRLESLDLVGGT